MLEEINKFVKNNILCIKWIDVVVLNKYGISGENSLKRKLKNTNYSFIICNDFQYYLNHYSPFNKQEICIECNCGKTTRLRANTLFRRRYNKEQLCQECYKHIHQYDEQWKLNNSIAQKIAQNKPETIKKHVESQKKRYENNQDLKDHLSRIFTDKWKNDKIYRDKVMASGFRAYVGTFEDLQYHSLLELGFILKCKNENKKIQRWNLDPIFYRFENREKSYIPDFIVDEKFVFEIKGNNFLKFLKEKISAKTEAIQLWCNNNNCEFILLTDKDLEFWRKKARVVHENCKKNKI